MNIITTGMLARKATAIIAPSSANFIFASHKNIRAETLYLKLKEAGVLVRWFNKPLIDNFLRITIGTDGDMDACAKLLCGILKG